MVELRKRKEPPTAAPALAKRNSSSSASGVKKLTKKVAGALGVSQAPDGPATPDAVHNGETSAAAENGTGVNGKAKAKASGWKAQAGATIPELTGFGGEVETHDGKKVTVKELLEASAAGVVVFTYPKASTPGCTTQACLFRDAYLPITGASLSVFGLSADSPKSNTTFATKQKLPYPLLCDPSKSLIKALGFAKSGPGSGVARGVAVIDKQGTVRVHFLGGPQATLDKVLEWIKDEGMEGGAPASVAAPPADDPKASEEAAKLAEPQELKDKEAAGNPDDNMLESPLIREPSKEEADAANTAAEVSESAKMVDGEA